MASSLAQSVITDFIHLEFYIQAGILKVSRHVNKAENLNVWCVISAKLPTICKQVKMKRRRLFFVGRF